MPYDLESHAKDGRCGLSRNEDIRRYVGKLVEKQTLDITCVFNATKSKFTLYSVVRMWIESCYGYWYDYDIHSLFRTFQNKYWKMFFHGVNERPQRV